MKDLLELLRSQLSAIGHKGSVANNISYLFVSKTAVLVANFFLMPIMSRIFDQEAFGTFGLLNNLSLICSLFLTLKLTDTFILKTSETEFSEDVSVTLGAMLSGWALLTAIALLFGDLLFPAMGIHVKPYVHVLVPFYALLLALIELQVSYVRRLMKFGRSAIIMGSSNLIGRLSGIAIGLLGVVSFVGLWFKEFVRLVIASSTLSKLVFDGRPLPPGVKAPSVDTIKQVLRRHRKFPLYEVPHQVVGMLITLVPFTLIARYYSIDELGELTMTMTLMNYPVLLLSNSVVSVYQRSAADWVIEDPDKLRKATSTLFYSLTLIGALGFGLVYWYGEELFSLFLGRQWSNAGIMASILSGLFLVRLVVPVFLSLRTLKNNQHWNLATNILILTSVVTIYVIGIIEEVPLLTIFKYLVIVNACVLLASIASVFRSIGVNPVKVLGLGLLLTAVALFVTAIPGMIINRYL